MPKLSYEGLLGTLIALVVVILDQAGVKNPYVLWIAFALALSLCLDATIRSDLSGRKKALGSGIIVLVFTLFALYLVRQPRPTSEAKVVQLPVVQENRPALPADVPQVKPIPKVPKKLPSPKIEQHGNASGAVGGDVTQGPCSNLQVGGSGNQSTINCNSPKDVIQSLVIKTEITCEAIQGAQFPDREAKFAFVSGPLAELANSKRTVRFDIVLNSPTAIPIDDNAAAVVNETFTLSPSESLIGRPISDLLGFNSIAIAPADWGQHWCHHVRSFIGSLSLNGVEVVRELMAASYNLPDGKSLSSFKQSHGIDMQHGIDSYLQNPH
jgi:hypothetical protein